jgi:hypothetical protein
MRGQGPEGSQAHEALLQAVLGEEVPAAALPWCEDFTERRSAHRPGPGWRVVYARDGTTRGRRALRGRAPGWVLRAWIALEGGAALALLQARG